MIGLRALTQNKDAAPSGIYWQSGAFIARRTSMMDVVMLAIGFVFFAVSIAYVYACDQL